MKLKSILLLATLLLGTSCSSYVNSIYKDMDQQEQADNDRDPNTIDTFDQYRKSNKRASSQLNRLDRTVTTSNSRMIAPEIKRQYRPEKEATKRVTANDMIDNGSDGSLWAGSDPNAFLFANSKNKTTGDIIQINVLPRLKNEITMELKKAFPDNPYEARENAENKAADKKEAAPAPEGKVADKKDVTPDGSFGEGAQDKISSVVVEEINREHLLIKGRKNVLYKNRKRMVEVQALVSRKDIGDNDTISSDAILETNVTVLR